MILIGVPIGFTIHALLNGLYIYTVILMLEKYSHPMNYTELDIFG